ncbi:MAG: zinc ribbon domain-containing protein [Planctomycetes bacterium]|nr:zinc ribbon domain-containing protein [Planctomycetota bacterium]
MPNELTCSNIVRWDNDAEKYVACGHRFAASGAMSGATIECPRCGGSVEIPRVDLTSPLGKLRADEPFPTAADSQTSSSARLSEHGQTAPPVVQNQPSQRTAPSNENDDVVGNFLQAAIGDGKKSARESVGRQNDADGGEKQPLGSPLEVGGFKPATLHVGTYCAKCGSAMNAGDKLCAQCGYHLELGRKITTTDRGAGEKSEGAKRWLDNALAEGESAKSLFIIAAILASLVLFSLIFAMINGMGVWVLLVIVPLLVILGFFAGIVVAAHRSRKGMATGEPPECQSFPWHCMLTIIRLFGWREPRWPFRKRKVLKIEDAEFSDDDLMNAKNLEDCQVLDLQGTKVSDRGIPYLTGLPELQFVILKKTQVTGAGAQLLQHASPAMWIWF